MGRLQLLLEADNMTKNKKEKSVNAQDIFLKQINTLYNFIVTCEECSKSFEEFEATYNAIKNKYHPVTWFFIRLYWFFKEGN